MQTPFRTLVTHSFAPQAPAESAGADPAAAALERAEKAEEKLAKVVARAKESIAEADSRASAAEARREEVKCVSAFYFAVGWVF